MRDEVLDLFPGRFAKSLDAAKISCVGLDQVGIELMLANDLAKAVADFGAAVVPVGRLRRELVRLAVRMCRLGKGTNLLDRADADAVSSRKIAANRRNASKSTGPRQAGKRMVAKNALKHGFFSKWLLTPHPDGKEDPTEYQDLYAALRVHYQPLDFLEEPWVEKIAVWSWRLRRLLRCESGQIARALAEHNHEIKQSSAAESGEPELSALSSPEIDAITDHLFLPPKEELDKLLRYEAMINSNWIMRLPN